MSIQIDVQKRSSTSIIASESQRCLKRGSPLNFKGINPRKRNSKSYTIKEYHEETQDLINHDIPQKINDLEIQVNNKLSISSTGDGINSDP